ncbi:unnamed protein product [Ectocarpus sp. 8 AP-2014]
MCRGLAQFVALVSALPSSRGWLYALSPRFAGKNPGTRFRRVQGMDMKMISVDDIWPQLEGKQTCANEAAGKVIREAWAAATTNPDTTNGRGASSSSVSWSIRRSVVEYSDGDTALQGLYARPEGEGIPDRLPGVILAHTAVGPQEADMILWKLDQIALLGYAAFALDMFGTGRALWNRAESLAARRPITEDRSLMQARATAAVRTLSQMEGVDQERLAAVGYCFGGMTVLDLARMVRADGDDAGANTPPRLKAVASLHGILAPISPGTGGEDGADLAADDAALAVPRVLVLHATADPFVPPEQVRAMEEEFSRRGGRLEIVRYGGGAMHAFTRPEKTSQADRDAGLSYCEHAEEDSWRRVVELLREEFA